MAETSRQENNWKRAELSSGAGVSVSTLFVGIALFGQIFSGGHWDWARVSNDGLLAMAGILMPLAWFAIRDVYSDLRAFEASEASERSWNDLKRALQASLTTALSTTSGAMLFLVMAFSGLLKH